MENDVKIKRIFEIVKRYYYDNYNLPPYDSHSRKREFVEIRHLTMYLAKQQVNKASLTFIGQNIDNKDHSSVLYAIKTVANLIETDKNFRERYEKISSMINPLHTIYICGSISKLIEEFGVEYTLDRFLSIEMRLANKGVVINPNKLFTDSERETFTDIQFMSRCIPKIFKSDELYVLREYKDSYNAEIEIEIAKNLNLTITYEED